MTAESIMPGNRNLHAAAVAQKDEFYTQLTDIEQELSHYREHFLDKAVYCNCDDPTISNFFKYFSLKFNDLGLKKLITTCYRNQQRDLFSQHAVERAIMLEYDGFKEGERAPNVDDVGVRHLESDGDFRSDECMEKLKQADVIVTNPPFSLFREYLAQLIEHKKQFLIIGPRNAITYKEVFPLIKENQVWLGYGFKNGNAHFATNHSNNFAKGVYDEATGLVKFRNVIWLTNLDIKKRHENLILHKRYRGNEDDYPRYDNYDAIEVSRIANIPVDWDGVMGVPITFLDKHNPDQFEILGLGIANLGLQAGVQPYKPEHKHYRKHVQKRGAVDGDLYMMVDGKVNVPYARILIRNRRHDSEG